MTDTHAPGARDVPETTEGAIRPVAPELPDVSDLVRADDLPPGFDLDAPQRVRRKRKQRPKDRSRPIFWAGVALVTVGLVVLGWVGWQFWGTNWVSQQRQGDVLNAIEDEWASGQDSASTDFGEAIAILHVPRWGDDYAMPILEGSSDEVLASGIGHMEGTALPGEKGNFAIAGHRITHGEPFADFPELEEGDLVHVETRTATYTYELDFDGTDLVVPFTEGWVLDPKPVNPDGGVQPPADAGERLITLLTCSEIFRTDNRSVVFGHLVEVTRDQEAASAVR